MQRGATQKLRKLEIELWTKLFLDHSILDRLFLDHLFWINYFGSIVLDGSKFFFSI